MTEIGEVGVRKRRSWLKKELLSVPYTAKVIEIPIASPGDVKEEREAAREIVLELNRKYTRRHKIVLLPRMWELDATPQLGLDPQAAVNEQFIDSSDILVAILWTRLGSPTPRGVV
jgi:hypothetical protein